MIARTSAVLFALMAAVLLVVGWLVWREAFTPIDIPFSDPRRVWVEAQAEITAARGVLMMWAGGACIPLALLFGSLAEIQAGLASGAGRARRS